jgi:uncharacterized RDD family membrane protein YckC
MTTHNEFVYAGFWIRFGATMLDTVLLIMLTWPPLIAIYGVEYFDAGLVAGWADFWISWILPAAIVIVLWQWKSATPGKMAIRAIIVDSKTGAKPTMMQWIIRYIGYYVSILPLGLGYLWVAWDPRKQGWHDKMAGTIVIRHAHTGPIPVEFENGREQSVAGYPPQSVGSPEP